MGSWNVLDYDGPEGKYVLLNGTRTFIRFSQRASKVDIVRILTEMEELGVPLAFTEQLQEIYFTVLPNRAGDYGDNVVRIHCDSNVADTYGRTLVHELGHHLDEIEDISGRDEILDEKKRKARMIAYDASKNAAEYVAVGFEEFYFGDRARLKKNNPRLYRSILALHNKYSRR